MCVIMVVKDGVRPDESMLMKAWGRNDHGAGIAWRETDRRGRVFVRWKKGLDEEEMSELCRTVPMPYVAHWRIASCGGILPELTHPFPVSADVSLALEGRTRGYVFFHNGTWGGWDDAGRHTTISKGLKVPKGEWSDSRMMAWLMHTYGHNFMKLLPLQRGVVFGTKDSEVFIGPGWTKVNDVWCSNDFFKGYHKPSTSGHSRGNCSMIRPMCQYVACVETDLDSDRRCVRHPKSSFPTNGTEGVSKAEPLPFRPAKDAPVISIPMAELLNKQVSNGKPRLSKNALKFVKKMHASIREGGKKGDKALELLQRASVSLLKLSALQS